MNKVQNYREVKEAFAEVDVNDLAKKLKTSINYMYQVIEGFKQVHPHRAIMIEKLTNLLYKYP